MHYGVINNTNKNFVQLKMTTTEQLIQENQICRLCYSRNTEEFTVDIYGEKGKERDYLGKINRYLYLRVTESDAHPKTLCWMCSNQLNTFHKFYEKVCESV